ncbi:MAG: metallophosphoesterase [Nitratireductor sp.]|nr:metallophosphoesterase [Nitratireductor sp.]MCB1456460.1 metallophosphoesterase [Nitratireductor sp.]
MFRLAHLSDIHLGPLPPMRRRELISKRITGYVNWKRNRMRTHQPEILARLIDHLSSTSHDHLAVTGDLINLGLLAEVENARAWLSSLGEPEDVTVTCGNHDSYVPGILSKAFTFWSPWMSDDAGKAAARSEDFPFVRRRSGISIIVCNSARASMPFMATGYFRSDQARALRSILKTEGEAGNCRVILIHHPPFLRATRWHKRLVGASLFRRAVAAEGAELVLHGHTHLASVMAIPGKARPVPVVGVPSAAQAPGGKRPAARYNLFSISRPDREWEITMDEYGYGDHADAVEHLGRKRLA